MSTDRSTRASVTLALVDTPVNVVIAQNAAAAVDRLSQESVDAIVVDARTIGNPSRLVDAIDSKSPETPTFVHWGEDTPDSVDVLAAVVARADERDSMDRLATAVTERIGIDTDQLGVGAASDAAETDGESAATDAAADLDTLVSAVRRRLVDVTSPITVEQILFEEFTNTDRFTFSWIGEYDHGEREIIPWLTDPETTQWPMQQTFSIGTGEYPLIEQTMRTRTVQTTSTVATTPQIIPLGAHAVDRGVDAIAVAPLAAGDDFYGVLVVYAPDPITDRELEAIESVADTASHVLESIAIRGQLDQQAQTLQRYERLVETAGDGMYVLDQRGHIMTVNDALLVMTGYSREGLLGEHVSILFDRDDVTTSLDAARQLFDSGTNTTALEMTMSTKAGSTVPCEVQLAALEQAQSYLGSVGVVRNITERKRDEQKLKAQNERLDAFARIVSHDLRNPLGVAQGYLDLVFETGSAAHLETVRNGLDRMDTIISDVLAIARDGEWVTDTEPIELETAAREAWTHVATDEARLLVAETMTIEADRSRFLRLLENCFRNSVEHGSTGSQRGNRADNSVEHGSTRSRTQSDDGAARRAASSRAEPDDTVEHRSMSNRTTSGDNVEHGGHEITVRVGPLATTEQTTASRGFYIEDNGRGLPSDIKDQLFDPSVTASGDLGIGLWIVNEVATAHGWSVTIADRENGGARFEFTVDTDGTKGRRSQSVFDEETGAQFESTDSSDTAGSDGTETQFQFDRDTGTDARFDTDTTGDGHTDRASRFQFDRETDREQ